MHRPRLPRLCRGQALLARRGRRRRAAFPRPLHHGGVPRRRSARSRWCGARSTRSSRAPASHPPATPRRRWWRSSTRTPATSCSRFPRTSCSTSRMGILALGERHRVRLFTRRDAYARFVSCLVFLPRDRFNTRNRERIQQILTDAFDAESLDFELRLSESVLVRIHFTVRLRSGDLPAYDAAAIEAAIVEATGSWTDQLEAALLEEDGEEQGAALYRRYRDAFALGYRDDWLARSAVADIRRIERLTDAEPLAVSLYHPLEAAPGSLRCKLYRRGEPATLSELLPMFESMGLRVRDERPYEVTPSERMPTWIYDFGVEYAAGRARRRRGERALPGRVHPRLARRGRERRLQRPRAAGRAGLARRHDPAGGRALSAAGADRVQRGIHGAGAPRPSARGGRAGGAVPRALRSRPRPRARGSGPRSRGRSRRRSTTSRASTRTGSCAASSPSCARCCAPTTSSGTPTAHPSRTSPSSSIPRASRCCRRRGPASRSSSIRPGSRACTCEAARSPAAACAGPIAARTSGPRSSVS